jgi:hypothetical protein
MNLRKCRLLRLVSCVLFCATIVSVAAAQNRQFAPDKMDSVLYGVAYYPEYMPSDRLDKDVDLMQKAGITVAGRRGGGVLTDSQSGNHWRRRFAGRARCDQPILFVRGFVGQIRQFRADCRASTFRSRRPTVEP